MLPLNLGLLCALSPVISLDPDLYPLTTPPDVARHNATEIRRLYCLDDAQAALDALIAYRRQVSLAAPDADFNSPEYQRWLDRYGELRAREDAARWLTVALSGDAIASDWPLYLKYRKACLDRGLNPTSLMWPE